MTYRSKIYIGCFNFFSGIFMKSKTTKHDGKVSIWLKKKKELSLFKHTRNIQTPMEWAFDMCG
jgi:hypothetical protein